MRRRRWCRSEYRREGEAGSAATAAAVLQGGISSAGRDVAELQRTTQPARPLSMPEMPEIPGGRTCTCPSPRLCPCRRFRERLEPFQEHLTEAVAKVIEEELEKLQVGQGVGAHFCCGCAAGCAIATGHKRATGSRASLLGWMPHPLPAIPTVAPAPPPTPTPPPLYTLGCPPPPPLFPSPRLTTPPTLCCPRPCPRPRPCPCLPITSLQAIEPASSSLLTRPHLPLPLPLPAPLCRPSTPPPPSSTSPATTWTG